MVELKTLSQNMLVRRLKRDRSINYLAIITSSWHYLSVLSTIKWLKETRHIGKGIVLVCEHLTDGHIINEDLLRVGASVDMEVYDFKYSALATSAEVRRYLLNHNSFGIPFYIMKPVIPKLEFSVYLYNNNVRKNIVHITIEEGLATYMRDWKMWAMEELREINFVNLWKEIKQRTWGKIISEKLLRMHNEFIENTLFLNMGGRWIQNRQAIDYLKSILEELKDHYDFTPYENYQNSIIICTQPYGEQKRILHNADIVVIRKLCEMAQENNQHVIIKPHPREKHLEKYQGFGVEIDMRNSVPLEFVLAGIKIKPKFILGITTTTLVTGKLLWNIPCISLVNLISRVDCTKDFAGEANNFCRVFSDIVEIPKDFNNILKE